MNPMDFGFVKHCRNSTAYSNATTSPFHTHT